jgi:DNA invertase Pin-like site-specific DNA recombinase
MNGIAMVADAVSMKPVDIYARVSRLKRDEGRELSTEGQVAVCRSRLADRGLPEGKVLVDPGRSAWNPETKRLAWDELMDRLEAGVSGGMIVFDLERFTRQPKDGERMIDLAVAGLLVLDSESDYDLTTPSGKKSFRDAINAAAYYYSDRLSNRVKRGLRLRAMEGAPQGHQRRFGFEPDHVTVREEEAEIIREATKRLLAGETRAAVVSDFNDLGIGTRYGKRWDVSALTKLLTREINCGRITSTDPKTGVRTVVGRMKGEPIVSEPDFDRVCAIIASRSPRRPQFLGYICSSAAVCGCCGHGLAGRPEFRRKAYPDGSVRRSYSCPPNGGCGKTAIDQRGLDEAAATLVVEILSNPRNANAIEAAAREAARLDLAITEAEDVAEVLADRLGRGELPLSRYNVAARPLDDRIKKLKAERAALPNPATQQPPAQETSREQWRKRWDNADHKEKRDLLKMALRGEHLVVAPAEHGLGSYDLADIAPRVSIG